MEELTIIFNAQITIIGKEVEVNKEIFDERKVSKMLKEALGVDDVLVDEVKVFITKEYDDEQVNHVE